MLIDRLDLALDPTSGVPASRQIAEALKEAIIEKLVSPGVILPSVRDIAKALDISRSTAARAIDELSAQGYVVTEMGSGTRVCPHLPGQSEELPPRDKVHKTVHLSQFGNRLKERFDAGVITAKTAYVGPLLRELPLSTWRELLVRHCHAASKEESQYVPEPFGYQPLREAYASYLTRARAVKVSQDRLVTFASRNLRLDLLARLLLNDGDLVAMEEPGFSAAREQFLANGAQIAQIGVDNQGLIVEQLHELKTAPRLIYVTPSHQAPTGAVMSMNRRKQLLEYAAKNQAYIIEDDYDSEFRYDGRPLPSLQGMDNNDRTIYLSCLWNAMAPVSRIGFMVVPDPLVEPLTAAKGLVERDVSLVEQAALADFINEGHLEKLIRKQRSRYAVRRQNLLSLLAKALDTAYIAPESAGLGLLVRLNNHYEAAKIDQAIASSQLPMTSTRSYYAGAARDLEFILSFAALEESDLAQRLELFAAALNS
ncbi:MAG: PLP-dependent aminotransferase family protein [Cyanobacteriota bacterium erpe_2018_sw_21hr_WHONDRS-SW48-000092_B_bin.40]|nr:PLP-dependent aminotransferase family protein [Cyanobacteriota bacterium erpe_2018_sw_21hr_WHONDRS-SW48-000092_B_bin.40]